MGPFHKILFVAFPLCLLVLSQAAQLSSHPAAFIDVDVCAPGCKILLLNDGKCDEACNTEACHFDGQDCQGVEPKPEPECAPGCPYSFINNGRCDEACYVRECGYDSQACFSQAKKLADLHGRHCDLNNCAPYMIGDGVCQSACSSKECQDPDCNTLDEMSTFLRRLQAVLDRLRGVSDAAPEAADNSNQN
eukprot:CAMPEP_0117682606 /NCGR_PEP_ID=MMETSP0804-20121206/19785_1 /TAXON_ID=1074897 /ORGANISM="Tetraselmis astigmatica, Strain CCMP880" /LENGTH=190 /DNA_ID=CAMNT_0005492801 /DNA_START=70 /DNA_END=642 /DNA_ORIENTATION=-